MHLPIYRSNCVCENHKHYLLPGASHVPARAAFFSILEMLTSHILAMLHVSTRTWYCVTRERAITGRRGAQPVIPPNLYVYEHKYSLGFPGQGVLSEMKLSSKYCLVFPFLLKSVPKTNLSIKLSNKVSKFSSKIFELS